MFDFPQPGEIYRSAGFPDVAVVGILEDGIPWEMPYRCPDCEPPRVSWRVFYL
ncbi:hypothetical protein ACET1N_00490 [Escherichia coli]|uniref:hypothetical protein n=1 Tax=Escherichia coli TaxID=562 RepID=UPI0035A6E1B1